MTTDELDPFEPKEQSKNAAPTRSAAKSALLESSGPVLLESSGPEPDSTGSASASVTPERVRNPVVAARFRPSLNPRTTAFALAFAVGAIASLFLVAAVALGLSSGYSSRVIPGVHVGSVDVSGLSRDEVIAKLQTSYAYLGQGQVTVTTPVGAATITYQQAGRAPDVEAMADAAMSVGHTGNPIGDAASIIRSSVAGQSVPVVVHVDPMALATRIHQLVGTSVLPPQNAQVTINGGTLALAPSTGGSGIDELAISTEIIDKLTQADAPADLQAGGTYVTLNPQVSDKNAQDAIAAAQKMVVNVALVWNGAPPAQSPAPSQSAAPTQSQTPPKTFTIDAQTIRGWIVFGTKPDGSYGPAADPALVQAYLSVLSPKVAIPAVEPSVKFDSSNTPVGVIGGRDGTGIDVGATSQAIEAYLDSLVSGGNPGSTIAIVTAPIAPQITVDSLSGMVKIGKGAWTTTFFPDVSNGNGVNIRTPAKLLNGQVVGPGQQFSFLEAMGTIDVAHGWAMGGVIQGGKSNHTGAIGGGICSASTTMFNAAARAGLQIDERHAHFYYINRYPIGLDATVYSNGVETWDLKWTNDTPYPIVIIARTTPGSRSTITIELWSRPIDRTVAFTGQVKTNIATATDGKQYGVSTLKPGQQNRAEYPTDGFDTSATRTVKDSSGNVIHTDTWKSHYTKVDGILQIGGSAPPSQTPTPSPGAPTPTPGPTPTPAPPTPAPTPTPVVTPAPPAVTPAPTRRRKVR
jgi:vancomycin resistance protein YoaR